MSLQTSTQNRSEQRRSHFSKSTCQLDTFAAWPHHLANHVKLTTALGHTTRPANCITTAHTPLGSTWTAWTRRSLRQTGSFTTSDRVVTGTPLHFFTTFVRIVVELVELFQPSIPVFVCTIYAVLSKNFWCRDEIHVGTRCTFTKNDLCVWRRSSFPTSYLCFSTFEPRFQQHVLLSVEQNC